MIAAVNTSTSFSGLTSRLLVLPEYAGLQYHVEPSRSNAYSVVGAKRLTWVARAPAGGKSLMRRDDTGHLLRLVKPGLGALFAFSGENDDDRFRQSHESSCSFARFKFGPRSCLHAESVDAAWAEAAVSPCRESVGPSSSPAAKERHAAAKLPRAHEKTGNMIVFVLADPRTRRDHRLSRW